MRRPRATRASATQCQVLGPKSRLVSTYLGSCSRRSRLQKPDGGELVVSMLGTPLGCGKEAMVGSN